MPFQPFAPFRLLARILRRDGPGVFVKVAKYGLSRSAWRWLLSGGASFGASPENRESDVETIRASEWFDAEWYLRKYPEVRSGGGDPAAHYAAFGKDGRFDPGPWFSSAEYLRLNDDVRVSGNNPLVHFERCGRAEGRPISALQLRETKFPDGAVETERIFPAVSSRHRRVAVFAAFFPAGRIPETTLCYLRGLREVADDVFFYANCPVFPDELAKLDGLVRVASFRVHGGHDFLSYRLGFEKARELGRLDASRTDELILANDSCYAPVFPLAESFAKMALRPCDFWGMTANAGAYRSEHVQSFFFVFRRRVLDGAALGRFLGGIEVLGSRWEVVRRYEIGFTAALEAAGYRWDTLVPRSFAAEHGGSSAMRHVLETLSRHGMPLVKVKALDSYMVDDRDDVLAFIRARNPELAAAIPPPPPPVDYAAVRRLCDDATKIARSPWFDAAWVLREYPEAAAAGCPPAEWYLRKADPVLVHPGPEFSDDEYLALHFDVFLAGVQPPSSRPRCERGAPSRARRGRRADRRAVFRVGRGRLFREGRVRGDARQAGRTVFSAPLRRAGFPRSGRRTMRRRVPLAAEGAVSGRVDRHRPTRRGRDLAGQNRRDAGGVLSHGGARLSVSLRAALGGRPPFPSGARL